MLQRRLNAICKAFSTHTVVTYSQIVLQTMYVLACEYLPRKLCTADTFLHCDYCCEHILQQQLSCVLPQLAMSTPKPHLYQT